MRKIYKMKPPQPLPKDLIETDSKKREKVEEVLGKKLTDREWFDYKIMIKGIKR